MPKDEWISVEDSLPPEEEYRRRWGSLRVLVAYDTYSVNITMYNYEYKMWQSEVDECLDAGCDPSPDSICCDSWVTHWMRLPEHPNPWEG